jgi:hypothetical protein
MARRAWPLPRAHDPAAPEPQVPKRRPSRSRKLGLLSQAPGEVKNITKT